jgi:hypothetical protein
MSPMLATERAKRWWSAWKLRRLLGRLHSTSEYLVEDAALKLGELRDRRASEALVARLCASRTTRRWLSDARDGPKPIAAILRALVMIGVDRETAAYDDLVAFLSKSAMEQRDRVEECRKLILALQEIAGREAVIAAVSSWPADLNTVREMDAFNFPADLRQATIAKAIEATRERIRLTPAKVTVDGGLRRLREKYGVGGGSEGNRALYDIASEEELASVSGPYEIDNPRIESLRNELQMLEGMREAQTRGNSE